MPQIEPSQQEIWLVDDEAEIRAILSDYLVHAGFRCREFDNGEAMLMALVDVEPDLILLDIMMPGHDGVEVCRRLRTKTNLPVIFLSARHEEFDRILGLKMGADDYLVKPISPREVVARVEAMLRRINWQAQQPESQPEQGFHFVPEAVEARLNGILLPLTVVEFRLLTTLYQQAGRVFKRSELLDAAYEDHRVVNDRTIDSHIKNLRAKLAQVAPQLDLIQSVYGLGYKLVLNSTFSP